MYIGVSRLATCVDSMCPSTVITVINDHHITTQMLYKLQERQLQHSLALLQTGYSCELQDIGNLYSNECNVMFRYIMFGCRMFFCVMTTDAVFLLTCGQNCQINISHEGPCFSVLWWCVCMYVRTQTAVRVDNSLTVLGAVVVCTRFKKRNSRHFVQTLKYILSSAHHVCVSFFALLSTQLTAVVVDDRLAVARSCCACVLHQAMNDSQNCIYLLYSSVSVDILRGILLFVFSFRYLWPFRVTTATCYVLNDTDLLAQCGSKRGH